MRLIYRSPIIDVAAAGHPRSPGKDAAPSRARHREAGSAPQEPSPAGPSRRAPFSSTAFASRNTGSHLARARFSLPKAPRSSRGPFPRSVITNPETALAFLWPCYFKGKRDRGRRASIAARALRARAPGAAQPPSHPARREGNGPPAPRSRALRQRERGGEARVA